MIARRGDTAKVEEVREFLDTMDTMVRDLARMGGKQTSDLLSFESIVLRLGRAWTAKARPHGLRKMQDKQCYRNSWRTLASAPGLRYVEGFAMSPYAGIPVAHAWCVNQRDEVIDPTWRDPEHCAYYGIVIPEDVLGCLMYLKRTYGFFGDIKLGMLIRNLGRLPTTEELQRAYAEGEA